MFLRQITFSILPGTGREAMSRHKGHRWQLKSFVTHAATTAVLGLRGNRPVTDYPGHWGSTKRVHHGKSAKVFKGQSCEPRVSAAEMCLGSAGSSFPCQSPGVLWGPALRGWCPGSRVLGASSSSKYPGGTDCGVTEALSQLFRFSANMWKSRLLAVCYRLGN